MAFTPATLQKLNLSEDELTRRLVFEIRSVFHDLCGIDDLMYLPLAIDPADQFKDCLNAVVRFSGVHNGLVTLHVSARFARHVTSCMLTRLYQGRDEEIEDAMGEVANILAGSFKPYVHHDGMALRLSPPSVVAGSQYAVHVTKKPDAAVVLLAHEDDWIMVGLVLEP